MSSKTYFCLPYLVYIEISSRTINDICNFMLIKRVNAKIRNHFYNSINKDKYNAKSIYLIVKYYWTFTTVSLENAKSEHKIFVHVNVKKKYGKDHLIVIIWMESWLHINRMYKIKELEHPVFQVTRQKFAATRNKQLFAWIWSAHASRLEK